MEHKSIKAQTQKYSIKKNKIWHMKKKTKKISSAVQYNV